MKNKKEKFSLFELSDVFSLITDLGFSFIIPIVLFAFIGKFLMKKFNFSPIFFILFIVLGLISSFILVYKRIRRYW